MKCEISLIRIEAHPDPEVTSIELGKIGDYAVVVRKGQHKTGDRVIYIPEKALVPMEMIEEMGLTGRLAGPAKNRVKPIRLRGVMSEGLVYPDKFPDLPVGTDVTEKLGVLEYVPRVPANFGGDTGMHAPLSHTFSIENIKKFPNIFKDGEDVVFTEKIHGTFMGVYLQREADPALKDMSFEVPGKPGVAMVASKGFLGRGIFFKNTPDNHTTNIYVKALHSNALLERLLGCLDVYDSLWVYGEAFGAGVQSGYGYGTNATIFRVFAIKVNGVPLDHHALLELCGSYGIETVPTIYEGPFSREVLLQLTVGVESVSGKQLHIREGVVVKPKIERRCPELGRTILKSVSEKYLEKATGEEVN